MRERRIQSNAEGLKGGTQMQSKSVLRRSFVLGIGATVSTQAWSNPGGGPDFGGVKIRYSQQEFWKIKAQELGRINSAISASNQYPEVEGFSPRFASSLWQMLAADRSATARLVREMNKIIARSERRGYLRQERESVSMDLVTYRQKLADAVSKNNRLRIIREENRFENAETYSRGVVQWYNSPSEGLKF
ncbi:MAG: hypothetical protein AAGA63_13490 [Pseudomonadota bacterium]